MPSIWNKYTKIKVMNSKQNIKTYLTRIEPLVKEITPKDRDDYIYIYETLSDLKTEFNIFDIFEENDKLYIIIDNNKEINDKIDKLITSVDIEKESTLEGHGNPINKDEILNLFKMEESMCKIKFERIENNKIKKGKGTGFFCEIENENFPIKYCLFTNNHVLNEANIEKNNIIKFEYYTEGKNIEKEIKMDNNRKAYTNKELDYTCIEILETDGIKNYFKIDPYLYKYNNNIKYLKDNDIFILQYPNCNDICISYGKILLLIDSNIKHSASTNSGSSGSPIIRRSKENYIIGLHYGGHKNNRYNIATNFNSILEDIKGNEIHCTYIPKLNQNEINLMHDYKNEQSDLSEEMKKLYLEAKNINEKLFKEKIELYVNDKKIKFNFKYKINDEKEIKVKFVFKKKLTNTSFMFKDCSSLESIDLSSFNTSNITSMIGMFKECSSLKTINLSSFNTSNVTNMSEMFNKCYSLISIDLSSFNTSNVTDMGSLFKECSSLISLDLCSFDTSKVNDLSNMFYNCSSLKSLDLSSFKTSNATNMSGMFFECSSLAQINLSSFNTNNVTNMSCLFRDCSSLISIDLSLFNTCKVKDMNSMFFNCSSVKFIDLSSFKTSNLVDMSYMFLCCSSLESIDLSSFDASNVTNMTGIFCGCSSLNSIKLFSFNNNIKDKSNKHRKSFTHRRSLKSIDLSSFNINMSQMFANCSSLKSIDLSSFNGINVTDISGMFSGCSSLQSVDLSPFNLGNIETKDLFKGCYSLKEENIKVNNANNIENCTIL